MAKPGNYPTGQGLRDAAQAYVRRGMYETGGLREAWCGFKHKTGPYLIGSVTSLSVSKVASALARLTLFCGAAFLPILIRKVVTAAPGTAPSGLSGLFGQLQRFDATDVLLGTIGVIFTGLPKLLEAWSKSKDATPHSPYYDLAAAVRAMPAVGTEMEAVNEAIRLTLGALQGELSELVGDDRKPRLTDITLLEFCDPAGKMMQVRARTANHEPVKRPASSERFLAYYVGMEGRWFAEHDFHNRRNPFPPTRVSERGSPPAEYRSILFLPVMYSERRVDAPTDSQFAHSTQILDSCIGVICVHSPRPFRFWRWGDHRKKTGAFGNVAYERSMPYIALVTRLLERSAHKVALESA